MVQFVVAYEGYKRHQELENHRTRMMMTYIKAFAGMGSNEEVNPLEVWPLAMDERDKIRPITDMDEAMEMVRGMLDGTDRG